jgi:thiol-disulfide isomerase/thioredoxin
LDNPKQAFTPESLKGKVYLIDFWAVWCQPCLAEMENLHEVYGKFKPQGFEILSLSLDAKPEDVNEFRRDKWKMPWLHSFVGLKGEALKQFEVVGIPKTILVNRNGEIVATGVDLRGSRLSETLEQALKSK